MNKTLLTAAALGCALCSLAAAPDTDPVLMTIDGNKVKLSEFEYLYNKNNTQQIEPLTIDRYIDMFVDYKLKVADACAAGIDTTQAYIDEFVKFRNDLATPYLRDAQVAEQLVTDVYDRYGTEVLVSHVMLPLVSAKAPRADVLADSVRALIASGAITFEDAAAKYSIDRNSNTRGGVMGWIQPNGRLPWAFEKAAFDTPVGEMSEVINSGFGLHIVRPVQERQAKGEVSAQHILILTRGLSPEAAAKAKEKIDSLYLVVTQPGADFGDVAKRESQDQGSAQRGGDLGWFGSGRMVAEFDSVAFALPAGEISKPFATQYGYHIVKNNGHRAYTKPTLEQARPDIEAAIEADSRARIPLEARLDEIAAANGYALNPDIAKQVTALMTESGMAMTDSASVAAIKQSDIVAYTVSGQPVTLGAALEANPLKMRLDPYAAGKAAAQSARNAYDNSLIDLKIDELMANNPEYSNLVNEYRDGILLFEISNRNVWEKASTDTEGLEQFFQAHKADYTWEAPRFKSFVIFAATDSVLTSAKGAVAGIDPSTATLEQLQEAIRAKCGRNARVEKVTVAQGENQIVDYLGFDGPAPNLDKQRMKHFFAFNPRLIDAPEEATDVKAVIITDYQNALEKQWLDRLHKTHKVKINKKALNRLK